jgi:hypothetical protein
MTNPAPMVTLPVDQASIAKLQARTQRRRALGYQNVPVPAAYLEQLLELAAKAVQK